MPRLIGVEIPDGKQVRIALRSILGVGATRADAIVAALALDGTKKAKDLTDEELGQLASHIQKEYTLEGELRREMAQNINRLRDIACYRGMRHRRGLPTRGQRTRTNARTRKGPKKTVAGKKSVKAMK